MPADAGSIVGQCEQGVASAENPVARETGSDTAKTARILTKSQAHRRVPDTKRKRRAPIAQASASDPDGPTRPALRDALNFPTFDGQLSGCMPVLKKAAISKALAVG